MRILLLPLLVAGCPAALTGGAPAPLREVAKSQLRTPADFAGISDTQARSRALFLEASRVMLHPRCSNCHPDGDSPLQGMDQHVHEPPVQRGADDHGVSGMRCGGCHQDTNLALARVPGAPKWGLAARDMAWVGKSAGAICEQVKDPTRNGGRTLQQIVDHNAHDALVGWAWAPGEDREPAPGSQAEFGALIAAWVETGAACPSAEGEP